MDSDTNGSAKRDFLAPASQSQIALPWYWPLVSLFNLVITLVFGISISIRDGIAYLLRTKKSVKGKVVVITGTGRGLGRRTAMALSRLGATIACVDINTKNNEETVQLIRQEGGKAEAFTVNVAKSQQVEQLCKDVKSKLGPADIVINNAALVMVIPITDMSFDDIRAFYEVNAMSAAFMTKAFLGDMMRRNSGHIVTISSLAARSTIPWFSLYSSTKAAVSKFMDSMHVELNAMPNNQIKITTIHPFFVNTTADFINWFQSLTPMLEENDAVSSIVDAILYEKVSVFLPRYMTIACLVEALVPLHFWNLSIDVLARNINLPTRKERDTLPYSDIVKNTTEESR